MKINCNVSAVISNQQLLRTEDSLADSMERLSSGLKLNHAKDDPSGMAISIKMRAQINGLDKANENVTNATSVLDTADGALNEVTSMLQRINELAVQAANGTMTEEEKESCQAEVDSLLEEIDRIAESTEFNSKSLLDGSLDAQVYVDSDHIGDVTRLSVSEEVAEGEYTITVGATATQASETFSSLNISDIKANLDAGMSGTLSVNGASVTLSGTMTEDEIEEALRDMCEYAACEMEVLDDGSVKITTEQYGSHAQYTISQSGDGLFGSIPNTDNGESAQVVGPGTDPEVTLGDEFSSSATVTYDGNKVTITDSKGFNMSMLLSDDASGTMTLNVTDVGILDIQVGADGGQLLSIRIPSTSVESLYLDRIDLSTVDGAQEALTYIDEALSKVTSIRSQLGAYTNRLEYTTDTLDATTENLESAISNIEDTDMASEMVEYTKYNVLQQSGTSALTQANSLPELALQILG